MSIPAPMRRLVTQRAGNRCEYCLLAHAGQEAAFHVDHILPLACKGPTSPDNLALACVSCSLRKGARQLIHDSRTGKLVPLFHPRKQNWCDHFRWIGVRLSGLTPTGRVTILALKLNRPLALAIRTEEKLHGRHP